MIRVLCHRKPRCLRHADAVRQQIGHAFVHTHRACKRIAPDIGNSGDFKQPLYGAVLTVFAVEYREHRVNMNFFYPRLAEHQQPAVRTVGGENGFCALARKPLVLRQIFCIAFKQPPLARLRDAEHIHRVFVPRDIANHRRSRHAGNRVLAGNAAE